jgi:hypothetical protein
MTVWEIKAGPADRVAMLVVPQGEQAIGAMKRFGGHGDALHWQERPRLQAYVEKRRKRLPRSDVSPFVPGALVLNAKAFAAVGGFLAGFGQLLELDVDGEVEYFFNATRLVPCMDRQRSEVRPGDSVGKETFLTTAIPSEPVVFNDAVTARSRLYTSEAGKLALEEMAAAHAVSGLVFGRAGL